ncbi:MAG: matrixin family metalloprotease [Planctomycetes bacterium]|nr:matrixin family metalloprotease [Planctomycetota bacterium]
MSAAQSRRARACPIVFAGLVGVIGAALMVFPWASDLADSRSDRPPAPRRAACFAPGTPLEVMERVNQLLVAQAGGPLAYFSGPTWSSPGTPVNLTWSLVPDGVVIPGGVGEPSAPSNQFATMDAKFGGNRAAWIALYERCFNRWAELTGNTYTRVSAPGVDWDDGAAWGLGGNGTTRGDVRIAMKPIDVGGGILAYNDFPPNGDMVMDSNEAWQTPDGDYRLFRNTVTHEHGHGIGLFHVCSTNTQQLMEPFLFTGFDGPQHDDLRGGQRQNGDPYEPDDSAAQATDFGNLLPGDTVAIGDIPSPAIASSALLSIDRDGEQDWFGFSIGAAGHVSVSVTPWGRSYDSSPQACGGSSGCCTGNPIDSLVAANLALEVFAESNLSAPIAIADSQGTGEGEALSLVPLPAAGTYYARVRESNAPSQVQLYSLFLELAAALPPVAPASPHDRMKNRYLSFDPRSNGATPVAIRVEKTSTPPFTAWVGAPDANGLAPMVPSAVTRVWAEPVVHVAGCQVVPAAVYELRASPDDAVLFSAPYVVLTVPQPSPKFWGDTVGELFLGEWTPVNGVANINDFLAALQAFQNVPTAPHWTVADVQAVSSTDPCVNGLANIADVFLLIKAFQGDPYPFPVDASLCPPCP